MKYLEIVVNVPINQSFTYLNIDTEEKSRIGFRADLKFGNRRMTGVVIGESNTIPPSCAVDESKIRPVTKFFEDEPLLSPELIETCRWISSYYICSIGEAVCSTIPGGKRETDAGGFSFTDDISSEKPAQLSEEQQLAVSEILDPSSKTNLHYLYGPTGTGKTEVFLQCAQKLLDQGKGVIYLVPEIGLTQQVIESVVKRFGNTAAVLHSGLTPSQKLSEWKRILNKEARVVIGARSAVFAPVPDLGMIIIDEEHDGSYKAGSTPRYHARQVAMYRCSRLHIPLVMGSATPSVESWYMMEQNVIARHTLTRRLSGGAMPSIKAINLSNLANESNSISPELTEEIARTIQEKKQTILFLNRRGFTHFFRCNTCGYELECKNCSVSMTYHKSEKRLRCHYCGWNVEAPQQCPQCGSMDVGYSGFGTEFIENEVKAKFPNARVVRVDTDVLTKKGELQEKLNAFKKGEYDIMLGTQMVAKGLNFPNLKLVGVILADTGLHLPDFRASERTFALITQVAGRAGRFMPDGKVLVQTYSPDRQPIAFSVANKISDFYKDEITTRQMLDFPPFSRLVRLVFRAPTLNQASQAASSAAKVLQQYAGNDFYVLGPSECPLVKISLNYRYQILLRGKKTGPMQSAVSKLIYNYQQPKDVYIETDVDPVSLL